MPQIDYPAVDTKIFIGKEIKTEERTIFVVIKTSVLKTSDGKIIGCWLTPIAVLVFEHEKQYAISIIGDKMTLKAFADLVPDIKSPLGDICRNCETQFE